MRRNFVMAVVLLLAFALRLHLIGGIALRGDEASNLYLAARDVSAMVEPLVTNDPHPPLYFFILHFWILVAGQSELALRFPNVFSGVLLVSFVYALARNVFAKQFQVAAIGAALAAISPSLIWDSQDAHLYSLLVLSSTASFVFFLRIIRQRASLALYVGYIVASAASLFFHYLAVFPLSAEWIIALVWLAKGHASKQLLARFLFAQAAIAAIFLPWLLIVIPMLANFRTSFLSPAGFVEILNRSLLAFTVGRADNRLMPPMVEPTIGNLLAVGFLVLFLLGLRAQFKVQEQVASWGAEIYLSVSILCFWLFAALRFSIFDERYVLFAAPAFLLIVAKGVASLEKISRWIQFAALLFVVVANSHSLYNYFYVTGFVKSSDWQSFMQTLDKEARAGDVLIQNYPDPALPYYLQNRMPRVLLPRASDSPISEVTQDLKRLSAKFERIWFQPLPFATWDTEGLVAEWLRRHARLVQTNKFRGVDLALYLPSASALRQAKPIDATLASKINLVAFEFGQRNEGRTIHAGQSVPIILYWQARDSISEDYTVFVHLYDSNGLLAAQQDNLPVEGTFPTTAWDMDQAVVDAYELLIPSDAREGKYWLMAGMYDSKTKARLSAANQFGNPLKENRVPLIQVEVVR